MNIYVIMKDGKTFKFDDVRPGGSYGNRLEARGEFLVITDVWDHETWLLAADVARAETTPRRR